MDNILPADAPAPRLCHLIKWPDFDGYGFNLHAERANPGQFIGKIDDDSPAQMAGLREGDRIVEVNGVNISNENHRQVVERIKSDPKETRLLVVDPETDGWYREQDIVIKSSQLNVVYMKTPVPRPESSSPIQRDNQQQSSKAAETRSQNDPEGSLETSDFNDDSIEQQQQQSSPQPSSSVEPPMSPDSGRGPDDEDSTHLVVAGDHLLTVEAEINRQSPQMVKQLVENDHDDTDSVTDNAADAKKKNNSKKEEEEDEEKPIGVRSATKLAEVENGGQVKTIQPDSLNCDAKHQDVQQQQHQQQQEDEQKQEEQNKRSKLEQTITSNESSAMPTCVAVASASPTKQMDGTETTTTRAPDDTKVSSGSAGVDSGQSSSADTSSSRGSSSSRSGSIADSLEDQARAAAKSRGTVKNYLSKDNDDDGKKHDATLMNNNNDVTKVATPTPQDVSGEQTSMKQPLWSVLVNNNNNTTESNLNKQQEANTVTGQAQQKNNNNANNTSSSNNNFSGLNLNMTASEMREILASRKKFDPKKAQMNIRQKYEIIQQM